MITKYVLPILLSFGSHLVAQDEPDSKPTSQPTDTAEDRPSETKDDDAADAEEDRFTVIRGADVYTGTGSMLRRASILIKNDKIEAVGHDLDVPDGATEIDATGKAVSPGFVSVGSSGFGAPGTFRLEEVADGLNPWDPSIKLGLAAGITSFGMMANEGRDVPRGKSAVLKLAPGDLEGMLCATDTILSMRMPLDRQQWRKLRELVDQAREHLDAVAKFEEEQKSSAGKSEDKKSNDGKDSAKGGKKKDDPKPPKPPRGTEEILDLLAGKKLLWIDLGNASRGWFMGGPTNSDN